MHTIKDYRTLPFVRATVLVFLALVNIQSTYCDITDQIDKQFNSYSFIKPRLIHSKHKREIQSTKTNPNAIEHAHNITLNFFDKGKEYTIDLSLNKDLISSNYFEKHQKNGAHVINRPNASEHEFCYYNGKIRDEPDSWAAISTCDGIRGMFFDGKSYHYIENVKRDFGEKDHVLYRHDDLRTNHTCGYRSTLPKLIPDQIKSAKRRIRSLKGPYNQNDNSRFIELVLVVDQKGYEAYGNDLSKVHQHVKDIANIINSLFMPLNIFVTLVGVIVWTEGNKIALVPNGEATLTNFLKYREQHIVVDHPNDNAQLLTKIEFENHVVGKALKGYMCTNEYSGGINNDHSVVKGLVATTIAHEMGHNLGMEHDHNDCSCPNDRCIMAPSSGQQSPTHWSSCSKEYLALAFEHGLDYCLRNKPEKLFESPLCGNGFVEKGEECDCGIKELCKNPCCNPETCMLFKNATCATGQCCDLNTCHKKPAGFECRSAVHECDLPEYCSGESEDCPDNVFKVDGSTCEKSKAYCYDGSCRTHTDQCRLLWGPTGESSSIQCYKMNTFGRDQGNCGYNRINKTFIKCQNQDILCGMLQCRHKNERLEFGTETAAILSHSFFNHAGSVVPCRTALIDMGLNDVDPGLSPNGAKCGENMMCVNQKCTALSDLKVKNKACLNDCNGNGVCNSKGNCHCKVGYAPPNCDQPGLGGSEDSGPASSTYAHKGFLTGMYVLTFGTIPLLLAVLLFAYCSKNHHSPSDWNKNNRKQLSSNDAEIGNNKSTFESPSSTRLINDNKPLPSAVLHTQLLGNYKGFSIKPLVTADEPPHATAASTRTPIRPAPCAPPVPVATVSNHSETVAAANSGAVAERRLQISRPVLDATTSSTARELVSLPPLKPAPPVPVTAVQSSTASTTPAATTTTTTTDKSGGYPTLRRITSFMKNQKPEDKKSSGAAAAAPRANAKFTDRELLKNLEISEPILQNEINVPAEPLPLEADRRRAVVLRAHSLRAADASKHRPSVHAGFGSMRRAGAKHRPTSSGAAVLAGAACPARPTSPPPPLPDPSYQRRRPSPVAVGRGKPTGDDDDDEDDERARRHRQSVENIYSVIDESPVVVSAVGNNDDDDDDDAYKVPRPLESSLLGEIVSAIQERNNESIYTNKRPDGSPQHQQQQTYENVPVVVGAPSQAAAAAAGPTADTAGYVRPADVESRRAAYDRPDLVKNCDENRSPMMMMNRSPDVLDAKKQQPAAGKPTVAASSTRPLAGAPAAQSAATATVGLKKKLSDRRQPASVRTGGVADIQRRFEDAARAGPKKPPVASKPTAAR